MIEVAGEKYYLLKEISVIIQLSLYSVRAYLRDGKITGKKVGNKWYVSESNLKRFLDQKEEE